MKKGIALFTAVVLALGTFTACNSSQPAAETPQQSTTETPQQPAEQAQTNETPTDNAGGETVKAYMVALMSGGAAWGQFETGFKAACAELGWDGQYISPQAANSTAEMVNLCETAITNGAKVLMTTVTDSEAFSDVLTRAKEAGVILIGAPAPDEKLDASIGTNPINLGKTMAETLVSSIPEGDPINVVTMQTDLTAALQIMQRDAFEERLFELRPDAKIVSYEDCNSNAATAQDKMQALYLANPDLNAMISLDSYAGLGAAAFVEENGLQGKFCVIGIDDAPEILRAILSGTMTATVAQMWYNMGYDAIFLANAVMNGGAYEVSNDSGTFVIYKDEVAGWVEEHGIDIDA